MKKRGSTKGRSAFLGVEWKPPVPTCPVCGQAAKLTDRGKVREEWRETYGHRDLRGEPCKGVVRQQVYA